jgi:hypothetical protein
MGGENAATHPFRRPLRALAVPRDIVPVNAGVATRSESPRQGATETGSLRSNLETRGSYARSLPTVRTSGPMRLRSARKLRSRWIWIFLLPSPRSGGEFYTHLTNCENACKYLGHRARSKRPGADRCEFRSSQVAGPSTYVKLVRTTVSSPPARALMSTRTP